MVKLYLQNFSMLLEVLSETSLFNLSAIGAVNATNVRNIIQIVMQINFNGSSITNVITLINKVTPHPITNKIGFMMF